MDCRQIQKFLALHLNQGGRYANVNPLSSALKRTRCNITVIKITSLLHHEYLAENMVPSNLTSLFLTSTIRVSYGVGVFTHC